jgi:hypothetical protein
MKRSSSALVPQDRIVHAIVFVRGQKVILDMDMARLYGVETRVLVQSVKRNASRFPPDFLFQLTADEVRNLKSQIVMSSSWGGRRSTPFAFTEHGVAMLSTVLRSKRAIAVNIAIMRAFVRLREVLVTHGDLVRKLEALENKYDGQFRIVFDAIRKLMAPASRKPKQIGFKPPKSR